VRTSLCKLSQAGAFLLTENIGHLCYNYSTTQMVRVLVGSYSNKVSRRSNPRRSAVFMDHAFVQSLEGLFRDTYPEQPFLL